MRIRRKALLRVARTWSRQPKFWVCVTALAVFIVALVLRLPYASHGMDQGDAVLYKNSLVDMHFYRENQWPLLLLFQKVLWLVLPGYSPQFILSLANVILAAATLALLFLLVCQVTKSCISGLGIVLLVFFMPLFGVYSVTGMQDMAQTFAVTCFLAAILQFCLSKKPLWLYAAAAIVGLALGVRLTLILTLPALIVAVLVTRGFTYKVYVRAAGAFLVGACLGLVGDVFIAPLAHSDPKGFFLSQFHMFNPGVIGYWIKAGDYTLFTGYRHPIFYWLPVVWVVIYILLKLRKDRLSIAPIMALTGSLVSLAVAYGLVLILGPPPSHQVLITEAILLGMLLFYESIIFGIKFYFDRKSYTKEIDFREKTTLVLSTLVLCLITFNYIFAGAVARYLLPTVPVVLLLILIMLGKTGWKSWTIVFALLIFAFWGCGFQQSQADVATFQKLDTRSAASEYLRDHDDVYYDFEATGSLLGYIQSYGLSGRLHAFPENNCSSINLSKPNFIILYGDTIPQPVKDCTRLSYSRVAKFQRHEVIIEDSVGNIGFTIYQLHPRAASN